MMKRKLSSVLMFFIFSGTFACVVEEPTESVRPVKPDWDTGWFQVEIFRQLLEELDYRVEEAPMMSEPDVFQSIAKGRTDFSANGWFPNALEKLQEVQDRVEAVGYVVRAGALQGYLVDRKTAEAHAIGGLADLQRPEIAGLFDSNGDGKADLIGCSPDWTCAELIEGHLEAYGLKGTVEQVRGNYDQLIAETILRYREGRPVLFYTWTPNWTVGELVPGRDVIWLEVPSPNLPHDGEEDLEGSVVDAVPGCASDPCRMGFPPNDIRVVANRDFLSRHPPIRRLFELVEVPAADVSTQNASMHAGEDSDDDIRRHARNWIRQNRTQVDSWLSAARRLVGPSG